MQADHNIDFLRVLQNWYLIHYTTDEITQLYE